MGHPFHRRTRAATSQRSRRGRQLPEQGVGRGVGGVPPTGGVAPGKVLFFFFWRTSNGAHLVSVGRRIGALECSLWLCRDAPAGHLECGCRAHYAKEPWNRSRLHKARKKGSVWRKERGGTPRLALIRSTCRFFTPPFHLRPSFPLALHTTSLPSCFPEPAPQPSNPIVCMLARA